ncbi:unnamed protein product [Ectocarpus sp. 6 AP-2014]
MSSILTCETGFRAPGLQNGEAVQAPIRILSTLISVTIVSAWCSWRKISRLSLFFSHWLSGIIWSLCWLVEDMMVTVCWAGKNLEDLIKTVKFVELASSHMLALTHLAICVNLALIVSSHRTLKRVQSVSSPGLLTLMLAVSMGMTAATVPLWETVIVVGTSFWIVNSDQGKYDVVVVSIFFLEFIVGLCMFVIVAWLLLFRLKEVKECWRIHTRIRYYLCLTVLGTGISLSIGICSTVFVLGGLKQTRLAIWAWVFRYIHIALDTFVLYGVLREKDLDERVGNARPSDINSNSTVDVPPPSTLHGGRVKDDRGSGGHYMATNPTFTPTPV